MENIQPVELAGPPQQLKTEILLFLGLIALGLWLVPAMIYLVGSRILGPYGDIETLAAFYVDLFGALLAGRGIVWLLVGSPYLFLSLIRLLAWLWRVMNRAAIREKTVAVK